MAVCLRLFISQNIKIILNILEEVTKQLILESIKNNTIQLCSTQTKLSLPVINRMYKKMSAGIKFSGIKVYDNLICDGHHRFIASILADFPIDWIPGRKTMATCIVDWDSVIFEENDWDSPSEINRLNQQDADFNNIPMEKIVELLK